MRNHPIPTSAHRWLGGAYAGAAVLLGTAAVVLGNWGWLLFWPATSCALMGACYATASTRLFARRAGRLTVWTRLLLAPLLWVLRRNAEIWTWREDPAFEAAPGVWVGKALSERERKRMGIRSVVNLAAEWDDAEKTLACRHIPVLDLTVPAATQIDEAVAAIDALKLQRPTLVCCALGYSRSAELMAAWLVASGHARCPDEAITALERGPRRVVLGEKHRAVLRCWAQSGRVA